MTVNPLVEDGFELRPGIPAVADYQYLRTACGLSAKSIEAAQLGLPNSWHGITVLHGGVPVGMGRIVGDGGCFFQVVDICVLPEHQGKALGRRIMQALTDELDRRAPSSAYVSLIADGDAHQLYRKFGFTDTAPASIGMYRTLSERAVPRA
ncbi:GNAT family N-acetyltransferase [Nocardia sp. NPDC051570]|uniref:GNAT family N-acetyltransferase n=1 Tax=Nocardia sp. NPDC051570 TaxID=3364324 RepID=UPI00379484C4